MKLHIKKTYYKNVRKGKEPCKYVAKQPAGINTDVYATIRLDPILRKKKLKKVRDAMVKHEIHEIRAWGKGKEHSHRKANAAEPKVTKDLGGTSGFWRAIGKGKMK